MVRSAAAVLAILILPSFALGQEPVGTHTVVKDDTLWDLAQFYYDDPFQWRVIFEANRDSIADPNLIYPDEVFVIPGLRGEAPETVEAPPPEPVAPDSGLSVDLVQFGFRQARSTEQVRTIFYTDTATQRARVATTTGDPNYLAVTRDAAYSAPWLVRRGMEPQSAGTVVGFATPGNRATTIRSYDVVQVDMPTPARIGAELQIFRASRTIEDIGQVVTPTGLLRVETITEDGVVATVTKEYGRIQPGDFVRPVPTYTIQRGVRAQEVSGGPEAMIMGFSGIQVINDVGHFAFLDLGSDDGITLGDEFVLYGEAIPTASSGALQVVAVTSNMATARITSMNDDVFHQGVIVRLSRKMR